MKKRTVKYRQYWLVLIVCAGCGGGGGGLTGSNSLSTTPPTASFPPAAAPQRNGKIEGYVYVPIQGKGKLYQQTLYFSRSQTAPNGYQPVADANVQVQLQGGARFQSATDITGHFIINHLPSGSAQVTITPPEGLKNFSPLTSNIEISNSSQLGNNGLVSLISQNNDHLDVLINQLRQSSSDGSLEIIASVIDPDQNSPLIGLQKDNFNLEINAQNTEINRLDQPEASAVSPASVVLLLDTSKSMKGQHYDNQPLNDMKEAAKTFVGYLTPQDEAALVTFNDGVFFNHNFTSDKKALKTSIDSLNANGGTRLFDGILGGIEAIGSFSRQPRQAIILITDGGENQSYYTEEAQQAIVTAGIPIYTIGLNGMSFTRAICETTERGGVKEKALSFLGNCIYPPQAALYRKNKNNQTKLTSEALLKQIAEQSQGEYFFAPSSKDLQNIYLSMTQRREQQYILTVTKPFQGQTNIALAVSIQGLQGLAIASWKNFNFDYPVNPALYCKPFLTREFYYAQDHLGEDIALEEGATIRAIGKGRIVQYEAHSGYGELVAVIEHDLGKTYTFHFTKGEEKTASFRYFCSIYGHIRKNRFWNESPLNWRVGDSIDKGETIGYINDALHNGEGEAHLHFGIRLGPHPGHWVYFGHENPSYPDSAVSHFVAFSELIELLDQS